MPRDAAQELAKLVSWERQRLREVLLARIPGKNISARAKALGVSRQTYYRLAAGQTITPITAAKLATVTGMPLTAIREIW